MSHRRAMLRALALILISVPSFAATRGAPHERVAPTGRNERVEPAPPAQMLFTDVANWNRLFTGCMAEGPGREYRCACAATYTLGVCRVAPEALVDCIDHIDSTDPGYGRSIERHCGAYGSLTTIGIPNAETRRSSASAPHQITAWNGGFNGCMTSVTPEERRTSESVEYTCACVATYLINACIAAPGATRDGYGECVNRHAADIQNAGRLCLQYGHLEVR